MDKPYGPAKRYGHSAFSYENHIIIFGGGGSYSQVHGIRSCLSDMHKFTPETG